MGQKIDDFCDDLRVKLTAIDDRLSALRTGIEERNADAEQKVRDQLDSAKQRSAARRQKVTDANDRVKTWVDEKRAATEANVASWKAERQLERLEKRAADAEDYAQAAADLAAAAIEEAEEAALEAWVARLDADAAAGV